MTNNISTKVVKLDLKTILANYKKPEFWSKRWTVIETNEIKVVWYITKIDCVNNKIESTLKVEKRNIKKGNLDVSETCCWLEELSVSVIPINNKSYTQSNFQNAVLGTLIRLLEDVERHCTWSYAEYKQAERLEEEIRDKLRQYAEEFLDENNVTNEAIRDAYIEKYVSANDKSEYCWNVCEKYKHTIIPRAYLYAYAWFDKKEEFDEFESKMKKRRAGNIEIWKKVKEIQTKEWEESMKNELKGI